MDINEFVKGFNDPKLKEAVTKLGNTPDGQKLLKGLTPADKQNLMNQIGKLNANGVSNEQLIRQLNNPNVMKQLNSLLNKKR
ncbi:MAG: hypothetical protein IJ332_01285 [Clostridia bacterium]|nr:hypothetical protein [Clostridia bacterium]